MRYFREFAWNSGGGPMTMAECSTRGTRSVPARVSAEALGASRRAGMLDAAVTAVLEAVPDFVMVLNRERQILMMNGPLRKLLGSEKVEEMVGMRPGEAVDCLFSAEGEDGCGTGLHCSVCGAVGAITESARIGKQ